MKVTTLDEKSIRDIGHAFGYYDYEEETGMSAAFSGKEALYAAHSGSWCLPVFQNLSIKTQQSYRV